MCLYVAEIQRSPKVDDVIKNLVSCYGQDALFPVHNAVLQPAPITVRFAIYNPVIAWITEWKPLPRSIAGAEN